MIMAENSDLPDDLMQTLKTRSCDRAMYDALLEERVMQEFAKRKQKSRRGLIAALVVVGALAAGGVGIAVAGGIQAVKQWFVVELVDPDGNAFYYVEDGQSQELHDADGNAVGEFRITTDADGKTTSEFRITDADRKPVGPTTIGVRTTVRSD
jgi:hypothetical protein